MSFFDEAHEEAMSVSPNAAATGPRVGFMQSFSDSYQAQVRGSALFGIEKAMYEMDEGQVDAMRRAGIEDVPQLSPGAFGFLGSGSFSNTYMDAARFYEDGGDPEVAKSLQEYDTKIDALRERHPTLELRTSREMWDNVRENAQKYEQAIGTNRNTLGGSVGAFFGGAVGAFNLEADPLNFATTPVGGAGKTVATRILGQGAAQGVIEGINQITGVQDQRRLLGLDYGVGDAVMRVGGAVVGGVALQGIGEGVAAGARRFFRGAANEGAPLPDRVTRDPMPDTSAIPPQAIPADEALAAAKLTNDPSSIIDYMHEASPLSSTRAGKARTVLDVDYMAQRLEEWDSGNPAFIAPKTDTAITLPRNDFVAPDLARVAERAQIDEMARRVDPETFRKYDTYADAKAEYKARVEELGGFANTELAGKIEAIDERIVQMMQQAEVTGGKRAAKIRKDIIALEAEKQQVIASAKEEPETARMRALMMREDEKMRDLAPLVSRAYARAQGKWDNTAADRASVYAAVRDGRKSVPVADAQTQRVIDAVQKQLIDKAPILQDKPRVAAQLKSDADAADVATAIIADNMKIIDEAVEQYRATLDMLIEGGTPEPVKAAGTVRVYHSGAAGEGKTGRWVSSDKKYASDYRQDLPLFYIDLPETDPRINNADIPDQGIKQGFTFNFELKPAEAARLRQIARDNEVAIQGQTYKLNLDRDTIVVPNAEGTGGREISIRQLLEENKATEHELEAVQTCSLRKTS